MSIRFEILMSTFNGDQYINSQINSIINQSYKDWKLSIADDVSKDDTINILKKYSSLDSRIDFYSNKMRCGPLISFFHLLKNSKEEYVIFCDQDDIWMS